MKTLKKTLCLVLAVVMVVGVLVLPANAAATTTEDTDATAAFKTLNEYGVMYGVDANHKPALDKNINRQDMAAIVYRIMTGDTTDKYVANYVGSAAKFADSATFATWAKGYIGYVRNNGIFMGDEKGNFKPNDNITGDEVLTVLLRCIGYGKNNEFTGAAWAENAETQATQIHLFGNATGYKDVKNDMSKVINRGTVAKLTYNAVKAPMVTYYNGTYSDSTVDGRPVAPNVAGTLNPSLISVPAPVKGDITYSQWGEPSQKTTSSVNFNYPKTKVEKKSEVALEPMATFWTAKSQCDLCKDLKVETAIEKKITVYTNGIENKTTLVKLDPLNTTAQIGAQGRYTAVYDTDGDKKPDIIVYKDTLLAKVVNVTKHTDDANGHLATKAKLELDVYAADDTPTPVTLTSKTDYTWTKGQYLLVNYHQNNEVYTNGNIGADDIDVRTKTVWENYETYVVKDATKKYQDWNKDGAIDINDFVLVLQKADSFVGAQTLTSSNKTTRTIENTVYNVNNRYHLDGAKETMKSKFTWYQDTKGNVIGSTVIAAATSFGVINKIYWTGSNGDGAVYAEVTYADGTTDKLVVNRMSVYTGTTPATAVTDSTNVESGVATNDYNHTAMAFDETNCTAFYVNADAKVNAANDGKHILNDNLFKIVASATVPGAYDFTMVGGSGAKTQPSFTGKGTNATKLDISFAGLGNATTDIVSGRPTNQLASPVGSVLVDAETLFLVRSGSASKYTFTTYTGYTAIGDYVSGEVDYANTDDDDAAEVVYITAGAKGEQGWHLFFNTSVATGTGNTKLVNVDFDGTSYTVHGILDGVAGSVKIKKDYAAWKTGDTTTNTGANIEDILTNTTTGNQLWIVYIKDGYVIDINGAAANEAPISSVNNTTAFASGEELNDNSVGMKNNSAVLTNIPYGTDDEEMGDYAKLSLIVASVDENTPVVGGNIEIGSTQYAVSANTPAIGNWTALASAGDAETTYTVIMVYDKDKKVVQSYIFETNVSGTSSSGGTKPTTPAADKLTVSVDGTTVTVNWHSGDYSGKAPSDEEIMSAVIAKLNALGWTKVKASGTSAAGMQFEGTSTDGNTTRTFTLATSAIIESIRVTVDGAPMLVKKASPTIADVLGTNYASANGVYVKAKLGGAAEAMKAANTTIAEGDEITAAKKYVKINSTNKTALTNGTLSVTATGVVAGTNTTASSGSYTVTAKLKGTDLFTDVDYLELNKAYTLEIKVVAPEASDKVKADNKLVIEVADDTNGVDKVENLLWGAAGTDIANGDGTTKEVTFTLSGYVTGEVTLAITIKGVAA